MLLIPDLIGTGLPVVSGRSHERVHDRVLRSRRRLLVAGPIHTLGLPAAILPELIHAGDPRGTIRPEVAADTGLGRDVVLTAVGSHDTASAVVGVPAAASDSRTSPAEPGRSWRGDRAPILSEASQQANFTNGVGRGRKDPLPPKRDGPLAAPGIGTGLGARNRPRRFRQAAWLPPPNCLGVAASST